MKEKLYVYDETKLSILRLKVIHYLFVMHSSTNASNPKYGHTLMK